MELRTYLLIDSMQPQFAALTGMLLKGDVPVEGMAEIFVELAPASVVRTALKAANLIGDGLYGVDLKQVGRKCYVIEVNDNPTIQAGFEDTILKEELYRRIMEVFLQRLERRRLGIPA